MKYPSKVATFDGRGRSDTDSDIYDGGACGYTDDWQRYCAVDIQRARMSRCRISLPPSPKRLTVIDTTMPTATISGVVSDDDIAVAVEVTANGPLVDEVVDITVTLTDGLGVQEPDGTASDRHDCWRYGSNGIMH